MFLSKQKIFELNQSHLVVDCACSIVGSLNSDGSLCSATDPCPCDTNGICSCEKGHTGVKCDECETGYYSTDGSSSCSGNYLLNIHESLQALKNY